MRTTPPSSCSPQDTGPQEVEAKAQQGSDSLADREAWMSLYRMYWEESAVCKQPG